MATNYEKFMKEVIGSKGKIFDYTSTITPKGDFNRIRDLDVILNSWRNILLTPVRSYDHDPEYGSEIYKYIFEPTDNETANNIKDEIMYRLRTYDNRARIVDVRVNFLDGNKGFVVQIDVDFNGLTDTLSTVFDKALYLDFMERQGS